MKRKIQNKKMQAFCLAAALIVVLVITVGGTFAWLSTETGPLVNTFSPGKITCEVEEISDGTIKENVSIKNTGNADAYIRAAVVANWVNGDGSIVGAAPEAGVDYQIELTNDWFLGADGYYYCKAEIAPKQNTPVLMNNCTVITENEFQLDLQVIASAVQSRPARAVQECWNVYVDADNRLSEN